MLSKVITPYIKRILELIGEFERYSFYKKDFIARVDKLNNDYQRKRLSYFEYSEKLKGLLKGKTTKEWLDYYNSQIYSLLNEIEYSNSKIFYLVYSDKSYEQLKVHVPSLTERGASFVTDQIDAVHYARLRLRRFERKEAKKIIEGTNLAELRTGALIRKEKRRVEKELEDLQHLIKLRLKRLQRAGEAVREEVRDLEHLFGTRLRSLGKFIVEEVEKPVIGLRRWFRLRVRRARRFELEEAEKVREDIKALKHAIKLRVRRLERLEERVIKEPVISTAHWFRLKLRRLKRAVARPFVAVADLFKRPKVKKIPVPVAPPAPPAAVKRPSLFARLKLLFKPKERVPLFERILTKERVPIPAVKLIKKPFLVRLMDLITAPFVKKPVISRRTEIGRSLLDLERLREKEIKVSAEKLIRPRVLAEEAERVAAILKKKEVITLYRPSTIGAVANLTVRKISLFFINKFPFFFEQLYRNLRLANIRILSNTYVNIMFFFTLLSIFVGTILFSILYASLISGLLAGAIFLVATFTGFYYYPINVIMSRVRSIKTNLPFAINHMSAVVNSGVTPTHMLRLIAESKEYGELVIEVEKIVEFIDLFGYDVTTAIKSVASTTPELGFKDFLNGLITTIESGGDIHSYFKEKADASMNAYQLERQKYVETISTYSDVYTGILIAAPLFFVVALALVSILGGTIMGLSVDIVIAIGTYIIIPFLNIAFIIFLELTQPMI